MRRGYKALLKDVYAEPKTQPQAIWDEPSELGPYDQGEFGDIPPEVSGYNRYDEPDTNAPGGPDSSPFSSGDDDFDDEDIDDDSEIFDDDDFDDDFFDDSDEFFDSDIDED